MLGFSNSNSGENFSAGAYFRLPNQPHPSRIGFSNPIIPENFSWPTGPAQCFGLPNRLRPLVGRMGGWMGGGQIGGRIGRGGVGSNNGGGRGARRGGRWQNSWSSFKTKRRRRTKKKEKIHFSNYFWFRVEIIIYLGDFLNWKVWFTMATVGRWLPWQLLLGQILNCRIENLDFSDGMVEHSRRFLFVMHSFHV